MSKTGIPLDLIEEVFSSRGRVRILYLMARKGSINITRLFKEAGLSYETTWRHLRRLLDLGIVKEVRLGRLRIFQLNEEHPLADRIVALFSGVVRGAES
mgnify:CR=1 FL=1